MLDPFFTSICVCVLHIRYMYNIHIFSKHEIFRDGYMYAVTDSRIKKFKIFYGHIRNTLVHVKYTHEKIYEIHQIHI